LNAPQTEEGWQALSVLEVCAAQLRMAQNTVIGLDFNAWRHASEVLDTNVCAMSQLFPAIEAGVTAAMNSSSNVSITGNGHG
jgi:hypothetical protein